MNSQSNIPFAVVRRLANDETGEIVVIVTENGQPKDISGLNYSVGFCPDKTMTELFRIDNGQLTRPANTTDRFVIDLTTEQRAQLTPGTAFVGYIFEVKSGPKRDTRGYFSYTRLLVPDNYVPGQPVEPAALQLDYDTTTAATILMTVYILGQGSGSTVSSNYTDAEKTKLAGIAAQATKNDTDANLKNRANHTGTQAATTITEDGTHRFMTDAERSKLGGVAVGATQNATDAQLRDRATHTGVQSSASISDFVEAVQDVLGMTLQGGTNVTVQYDDPNNRMIISASGTGGGSTDPEVVRDAIGVALVGLGLISVVANDEADTITITTQATQNDTNANLRARASHTGMQAATTITEDNTHRFVTDTQIAAWAAKQDPITATLIRNFFTTGSGLIYDKANGQFYVNTNDINTMVRNYLRSRDGFAAGKVLSATADDFLWVTSTSTGGGTTPTTPTTPVAGFANPTDETKNRVNTGLMTDVNIDTVAQLVAFCEGAQTNKRGILTAALYNMGSVTLLQKGAWSNVLLISSVNSVIKSSQTTAMMITDNQVRQQVKYMGVTWQSTASGVGGYPVVLSNELVPFKGQEFAYCKCLGTQVGNYNAFGVSQYSNASNSGAVASDLWIHHCYFSAPRMGIEILSQGYDTVRLTNMIVTDNTFENTQANSGEDHRMSISFSGLITNGYVARNKSINAKDICYEFVNVKYFFAEDNEATATLEPAVAYSVSDDGVNSTESIYIKGGTFTVTSRPFQIYQAKDVHFMGGVYRAGRGIDLGDARNCSFDSLDVQCTNLLNAEAIFQFGGTSNNNELKNSTLSSWGSAALGHEPSYETVVERSNTYGNKVTGNTLKQGKRPAGGYFTNGQVVNQGANTNTESSNTVQLES